MRYVMPVLLAFVICLLVPAHVAGETTDDRELVQALREPVRLPVETLGTLTGLQAANPTACVSAEVSSARGWLSAHYGDNVRWEFADIGYGGLAYPWHNLIVIDSDMNGTCGYGLAVAFHEWMHIKTTEYFGSWDKSIEHVGCGPITEFGDNICINLELIADCGGKYLSQLAGVKEHHPYIDAFGCSDDQMVLAQRVINGY